MHLSSNSCYSNLSHVNQAFPLPIVLHALTAPPHPTHPDYHPSVTLFELWIQSNETYKALYDLDPDFTTMCW